MSNKRNSRTNNDKIKYYPYSRDGSRIREKYKINNNNKPFDLSKYIIDHNIDGNYNDTIPENDSIVYFLILSHGSVNFVNHDDDDENKNVKPQIIRMPNELEYFNKITYSPLGFANITTINSEELIKQSVEELIKTHFNKNENPLVHNQLSERLPDVDGLLKQQRECLNRYLTQNDLNDDEIKHKCELISLSQRKLDLYNSVVYDKNNNNDNIEIINKTFSIDEEDRKYMVTNIHVVYTKGGNENGNLLAGDNILGSKKYIEYLKDKNEKEIKKQFYNSVKDRIGRYESHELAGIMKNLEQQAYNNAEAYKYEITTRELLEFALSLGFKRVIAIDYSCDTCSTQDGKPVPIDLVMHFRKQIKENPLLGRGIDKKLKKTKKHISRKLKKNRKSKKYKKM
jgi:hypothetical protein